MPSAWSFGEAVQGWTRLAQDHLITSWLDVGASSRLNDKVRELTRPLVLIRSMNIRADNI